MSRRSAGDKVQHRKTKAVALGRKSTATHMCKCNTAELCAYDHALRPLTSATCSDPQLARLDSAGKGACGEYNRTQINNHYHALSSYEGGCWVHADENKTMTRVRSSNSGHHCAFGCRSMRSVRRREWLLRVDVRTRWRWCMLSEARTSGHRTERRGTWRGQLPASSCQQSTRGTRYR